ncbi:MAG: thymidine phosphorylase [Clostridia bacterium]|nr:thymidine phosphorylase [Clostridia bacterium]
MTMLEIIEKKKLGKALSPAEIQFFAEAAAQKSVPDYQLAALLMAIRLNGMTDEETTELTLAMRDTGDVADLSSLPGVKVDKHSTGGVGDTTTLVLAPLVAACGAPVAKMSGRGLGHTGGTLDKLESIPGLRVSLTEEEFIRQVKEIGVAVVGQTGRLAPADKTLYALRDVTSTVDSIPLIVSSILSKKLAAGSDAIVLDVKTGSGALMQRLEDSIHLAQMMVNVGTLAGKPTLALISGMDQPLGTHVGNALEVKEAIDILAGRAGGDLKEVSLTLGGYMLVLAGLAQDHPQAVAQLTAALESGAGLEKLKQMIAAQGGDPRVCDDVGLLPQAPVKKTVLCGREGYVAGMDTMALGTAAQTMGAGRTRVEDQIDYSVGYVLRVRVGDRVTPETPLCELHARTEEDTARAEAAIRQAISWSDAPCEKAKNFYALVTSSGVTRL